MVENLVENGADVRAKDRYNQTAFMVGPYAIQDYLFKKKACIISRKYAVQTSSSNRNNTDKENEEILAFASKNGRLEIIKYLVEQGANVNNIFAPLVYASSNGH